jgi:hypothetical protein
VSATLMAPIKSWDGCQRTSCWWRYRKTIEQRTHSRRLQYLSAGAETPQHATVDWQILLGTCAASASATATSLLNGDRQYFSDVNTRSFALHPRSAG